MDYPSSRSQVDFHSTDSPAIGLSTDTSISGTQKETDSENLASHGIESTPLSNSRDISSSLWLIWNSSIPRVMLAIFLLDFHLGYVF